MSRPYLEVPLFDRLVKMYHNGVITWYELGAIVDCDAHTLRDMITEREGDMPSPPISTGILYPYGESSRMR